MSINDFISLVSLNHPMINQAKLIKTLATNELLQSRGNFDPKIQSSFLTKRLDGKDYYNLFDGEIKIPTWIGIDAKAGFERNVGFSVDNQDQTNFNGLSYAGISVPVGRGLFFDQRRAEVQIAKNFVKLSEAEQIKVLNKLLYDFSKDYWEWYASYYKVQYLIQGYTLAQNRYNYVNTRVLIGEEPAIDSVEASILLNNRFVALQSAKIEYQYTYYQISTHLWDDQQQPVMLDTSVTPTPINSFDWQIPSVEVLVEQARINHPENLKYVYKLGQLKFEKKLASEMFKPQLNLNYNAYWKGSNIGNDLGIVYFKNNYKYGFDLSLPILFRKERGKYKSVKIKIEQTKFEQMYVNRQIQNQIRAIYNEANIIYDVLKVQTRLTSQYKTLKDGEFDKFDNGESSLFLVNTRESSLIDAQVKLAELISKFYKSQAGVYWACGTLSQNIK